MRRRRLWLTLVILATAIVVVVGGLGLLLKQAPAFYVEASASAQVDDDKQLAYKMPEPFHNLRIAVEGDRIKIGGRIGDGLFSTIASAEIQTWLVDKEVNTVAVKICDLRFGAVPWESQIVLDWLTDWARNQNIDVTWYRHEGLPVGIFRFYANLQRPQTQIRAVMVADGRVAIRGRTTLETRAPSDAKD